MFCLRVMAWLRVERVVNVAVTSARLEKRASKSTPDAGLILGSQEILCLPAGCLAAIKCHPNGAANPFIFK